jgi:hypothetical protein
MKISELLGKFRATPGLEPAVRRAQPPLRPISQAGATPTTQLDGMTNIVQEENRQQIERVYAYCSISFGSASKSKAETQHDAHHRQSGLCVPLDAWTALTKERADVISPTSTLCTWDDQ